MDTTSITQLCIDLPESGLMNECRQLAAGYITICDGAEGPYQLHITCDNAKLQQRSFLCAVIDARGREYGEFQIACADIMKTMRGLYLRLSDICAYHLQQAYDRLEGEPAPITQEAIPEAGSAADQIPPLLPDWLDTTATGRRQFHRCLFDVLGAQMDNIAHRTLLEMMGIAPAAEAEQHGTPEQSAGNDFTDWHPFFYANDQSGIEAVKAALDDTASAGETDRPAMPGTAAHYHGLISRAMN